MNIEYVYEMLGTTVTVETNDLGSMLRVTIGDTVVENSTGECITWPQRWQLLSGAARVSAEKALLRRVAERSILDFIEFAAGEFAA